MTTPTHRSRRLEILRPGPAHNQLLSPLVPYVAVCDGMPAETIRVEWEHRQWLNKLATLRYDDERGGARVFELQEVCEAITRMLERVPGVSEAVEPSQLITHLRLVLSAEELAALPFEALLPPKAGASAQPVVLDTTRRVVITREARADNTDHRPWPASSIRVLFAWSDAAGDVPHDAHLAALVNALAPWERAGEYDGKVNDPILTILPRCNREQLRAACANERFDFIHLLAHGAPIGDALQGSYGLAIHARRLGEVDVLDAHDLVRAVCPVGRDGDAHVPASVVLAACDSGSSRTVISPTSSLAYHLHLARIPLVIGSTFPLSKLGSAVFAEALYPKLLDGHHPVVALEAARTALGDLRGSYHDWASVIAYTRLDEELWDLSPWNRASRMFERIKSTSDRAEPVQATKDQSVHPEGESIAAVMENVIEDVKRFLNELIGKAEENDRMQTPQRASWIHTSRRTNQRRVESLLIQEVYGQLGSAYKRLAEILQRSGVVSRSDQQVPRYKAAMKSSLDAYAKGTKAKADDHWTPVQAAVMEMLIHDTLSDTTGATLEKAKESAENDTSSERWGEGSLYEIELLMQPGGYVDRAAGHLAKIKAAGQKPWVSARNQVIRYAKTWPSMSKHLPGASALGARMLEVLKHPTLRQIIEEDKDLSAIIANAQPTESAAPDSTKPT